MDGPLMQSLLQNGALGAVCVVMSTLVMWMIVNHRAHMEHLRSRNSETGGRLDRIERELLDRLDAVERELKFQRDRSVDLERRIAPTKDLPVVAQARGPADQCPFCRASIAGDEVVRCLTCETEHHPECYSDHDSRCAVFGCGGRASASGTRAEIRALA